jgi:peptide/nickel transport system permease protein
MFIYIARRLLWTLVVMFAVVLLSFIVFFKLPTGDPALRFAGRSPTPELIKEIHHRLNLDQPVYVQFGDFVKNFFTGDANGWPGLGYSWENSIPVKQEITQRAPRTLLLILGAATLWLIGGIAIGVISAVRRRSIIDRVAMGFALFGISAPVFWLGLMALYIFWKQLHWTGGSGYVPITQNPAAFFSHMVLPWVVLALLYMAVYARLTRGALLETLGEDYIRTARAKGLSERRVIFRHGLRASLTPIATIFPLDMAQLVGTAVITETVFNLQGLGWLAINSTLTQDLPTVLGVVLVGAMAVAIANLVADILYAFLDPRVRYA